MSVTPARRTVLVLLAAVVLLPAADPSGSAALFGLILGPALLLTTVVLRADGLAAGEAPRRRGPGPMFAWVLGWVAVPVVGAGLVLGMIVSSEATVGAAELSAAVGVFTAVVVVLLALFGAVHGLALLRGHTAAQAWASTRTRPVRTVAANLVAAAPGLVPLWTGFSGPGPMLALVATGVALVWCVVAAHAVARVHAPVSADAPSPR